MDTSFERKESKEDWITPPELVKQFGHFDLDPCASHFQREFYADENIFIEQNGLSLSLGKGKEYGAILLTEQKQSYSLKDVQDTITPLC